MKQKDQVDLKYSEIADAKNAIVDFWPADFLKLEVAWEQNFSLLIFVV